MHSPSPAKKPVCLPAALAWRRLLLEYNSRVATTTTPGALTAAPPTIFDSTRRNHAAAQVLLRPIKKVYKMHAD